MTDRQALDAFTLCCRTEGVIPALECAHAIAGLMPKTRIMDDNQIILMNLSGRGDKDMATVARELGRAL